MMPSFAISRIPAAFGVHTSSAIRVKPSGQAETLVPNPISMINCSIDANANVYVLDANRNRVPLPSGAIGCDANGQPIDASGHIITFRPTADQQSGLSSLYIVGAVAALLVVGAAVYFGGDGRPMSRRNPFAVPSIRRSSRTRRYR